MNKNILILDDEINVLNGIKRNLRKNNYQVDYYDTVEDAMDALNKNKYAVVISDYYLQNSFGSEFLLHIKKNHPNTVRVLMTGKADLSIASEAINKTNIFRIILKPFNNFELTEVIEDSLHQFHLQNLETIDNLKNEFFSIISHEFRTPFTVINNYLELIEFELEKENIENKNISNYINTVSIGSKRILRTINLIVNLALSQSENSEPKKTQFNIYEEIILPITKKFEQEILSENIEIVINAKNKHIILYSDLEHTTEIFTHLLENAILFTKNGKIEITLSNLNHRAFLSVSDTGIGISEEYMSKIFEPFIQEHRGYSRLFDGNGLGLTLVKKYCELNGYKLSLKSVKDQGSTFTITFDENIWSENER